MKVEKEMEERILNEAKYFLEHKNATVRTTAKQFGVSKSTVHLDLTKRLKPYSLYSKVRKKLDINKEERSMRGGEATKNKYLELKK